MADVTVMGAGIFGLSVAYACARRGARVQVVDPGGVAAGASGGVVGALAPHVPENWNAKKAFQLDSLLMAEGYWAEVAERSGLNPGYARLGRWQPLLDGKAVDLAKTREAQAMELWQSNAVWRVTSDAPQDWRVDSPTGYYIWDDLSARIHPREACHALAGALRSLGTPVVPDAEPDGASAATVWATGWQGLLALSDEQGKSLGNGVKGQGLTLAYDACGNAQLFADGLHIVPHANRTVAIGSTSERDFNDPTKTDALCDKLETKARLLVPALRNAPVVERWAGVRPRAKSRAPMLGPWPGRPRHFIANGGFKIGFGMAPKVGEVMANLVLEELDAVPEGFRVSDN